MFKKFLLIFIFSLINTGLFAKEIAITDMNLISQSALAVKDLESQLTIAKAGFEADVKGVQDRIKEMEQGLKEKQEILSKEAFDEQLELFRKNVEQENENVQIKKNELEALYLKMFDSINAKTLDIIGDISKAEKIDIVIAKSQVLFVGDNVQDISKQVLAELDKQLPKVHVEEK